jgi:3D (Asp-Asp-Asp) domain-containing protein
MERWLQIGVVVAVGALAVAVLTGVAAYRLTAGTPDIDVTAGLLGTAGKVVRVEPIARPQPLAANVVYGTDLDTLDMPRVQSSDVVHETARLLSVEPPATAELTPPAVAATPYPLATGDRVQVTLSFYYCEHLDPNVGGGDGGGFCGRTADGSPVAPGVAACDAAYLGQLFRIQGDPLARVYRCADTGSAVGGLHRDIWFDTAAQGWAWIDAVGHVGVIEILR